MKVRVLLFALALVAAFSCKKKKDDPKPGVGFDIAMPTEGQTFAYGQVVQIRTTVTGPDTMHGYEGWVINLGNNDTLVRFAEHDSAHGKQMVIVKGFTNTVTADATCELTIQANINHTGTILRSAPRRFTLKKR